MLDDTVQADLPVVIVNLRIALFCEALLVAESTNGLNPSQTLAEVSINWRA